ncbi:hypothetical protein D3C81_1407210 [compost metagenome]
MATASAVNPIPQYQSGCSFATTGLGTIFQPPKGIPDITSTPPAIITSAIPVLIFATAVAIVSKPEAQYRLTVTPGTLSVSNPISEMKRAILSPCSASGMAFPTMTSSISSLFKFGTVDTRCLITSVAKSSARIKRNTPRGALPTAVRNPATIYASIIFIFFVSSDF